MTPSAEYAKRRREKLKALGLCVICKKQAIPGQTMCQKHREQFREYSKRRRREHITKGLCSLCSKPLAKNSKCFCEYHAFKNTQKSKRPGIRSGKMKQMFYVTPEEYEELRKHLEKLRASQN
jgi:hypothetical protein